MSSQIDRSFILHGLKDFVSRWHHRIDSWETDERSTEKRFVQTFWSDLLRQFGVIAERVDLYADAADGVFFTEAMRNALLDACRFRWTRISPAVFGSMFQTVKSKEARRTAGEHYTTETNILKTLNPLFLDDLQAQADRLCRNARTTHKELAAFRDAMATDVFLDPSIMRKFYVSRDTRAPVPVGAKSAQYAAAS